MIEFLKIVASMPGTLTPDAVYAVRVGDGFDLYIANSTGTVAHQVNAPAGVLASIASNTADIANNAQSLSNLLNAIIDLDDWRNGLDAEGADLDTLIATHPNVLANTAKVSATGSVTTHSDVTSAGSGQIITTAERALLGTAVQQNTNAAVTGVTMPANGAIIIGTSGAGQPTPPAGSVVLYATNGLNLVMKNQAGLVTNITQQLTDALKAYQVNANLESLILGAVSNANGVLTIRPYGTSSPPTPAANSISIYSREGKLFIKQSTGTIIDISSAATTTLEGRVALATSAEVDAGTNSTKAITPAALAASGFTGDTTIRGVPVDATVATPSDGDILVYRSAGSDFVLEPKPAGGAGATNLAWDAATSTVTSDSGTDATLTEVDATNPGLMSVADKSKLNGVEVGATANSTDATLLNRANHTGTQTLSTISDAGTAASLNAPASGDAAAGEVVRGDDSRLTDSRTPTAHTHTPSEITDFDTAVAAAPAVAANTAKVSATGSVTTHSDVTSAGSGQIITDAERTTLQRLTPRTQPNNTSTIILYTAGGTYRIDQANAAATYTVLIDGSAPVGSFDIIRINAPSEPGLTFSGNKIAGANFVPNTDMHMVIRTLDGSSVEYFFLEI